MRSEQYLKSVTSSSLASVPQMKFNFTTFNCNRIEKQSTLRQLSLFGTALTKEFRMVIANIAWDAREPTKYIVPKIPSRSCGIM